VTHQSELSTGREALDDPNGTVQKGSRLAHKDEFFSERFQSADSANGMSASPAPERPIDIYIGLGFAVGPLSSVLFDELAEWLVGHFVVPVRSVWRR
jgi:hypothetical protein